MRTGVLVLMASGVVLTGVVIFLLLFWFAFPRWCPEVVIRHSPFLGHVLLADFYRYEQASTPTVTGGVIYPEQRTADYSRFEKRLGSDIYAAMATHDDGARVRASIVRYLGEHVNQQKARILLWKFRDGGDREAGWILRRYTDSLDQGIKGNLQYDKVDSPRKEDGIRPDKSLDRWK